MKHLLVNHTQDNQPLGGAVGEALKERGPRCRPGSEVCPSPGKPLSSLSSTWQGQCHGPGPVSVTPVSLTLNKGTVICPRSLRVSPRVSQRTLRVEDVLCCRLCGSGASGRRARPAAPPSCSSLPSPEHPGVWQRGAREGLETV